MDQVLIDEKIIDLAWSKLQQLPSPMVEEPKVTPASSTVEFGELEEIKSTSVDEAREIEARTGVPGLISANQNTFFLQVKFVN